MCGAAVDDELAAYCRARRNGERCRLTLRPMIVFVRRLGAGPPECRRCTCWMRATGKLEAMARRRAVLMADQWPAVTDTLCEAARHGRDCYRRDVRDQRTAG